MSKHLKEYYNLVQSIKNTYDTSKLSELKENADVSLSKHIEFVENSQKLIESVSDDNNFGNLKLIFESMCPTLFKTLNGRALINKYIDVMKSNSDLKSLTILHENIMNPTIDAELTLYIKESLDSMPTISNKMMKSYYKKMIPLLSEAINIIGVESAIETIKITDDERVINESIDKLIFSKRNLNNISNRVELIRDLSNFMKESFNKQKTVETQLISDIENIINEDTSTDIKIETDTVDDFLTEQSNCLTVINGLIEKQNNSELKDRLIIIRERVNEMKCIDSNKDEYIGKLKSIQETLITQ